MTKVTVASLILLTVSFAFGVVSFMSFADSSPVDPSFFSIWVLVAAYSVGVISAVRLVRSSKPVLAVTGGVALAIQSFVMLVAWILAIGRESA